ncbi:3-deoxy-D-manno-octulosonate 8-phosphate phosphatase [Cronobacter dublinensis 582]|nr:3-deoxy-D-manno-octulosonate 8-phosphate phosphatase [Cronobacter dublinensis 582]
MAQSSPFTRQTPLLTPKADYVTQIPGGRGAVREVCDLLLLAQGKLAEAIGQSI